MRVLISQRHIRSEKGADRDALEHDYISYYGSLGIILIPVSNTFDVEKYFDEFPVEGVILSGGNDVDPASYNEEVTYANDFSKERDNTERALLENAIKKDIPVLCICRGMQYMNVFFKGKLVQDIEKELNIKHPIEPHNIEIKDDKVIDFLGKNESIVNSYHKQGITPKTLSLELKAFAFANKGEIIEGIYHPEHRIAGIQWHPERQGSDKEIDNKLISAFLHNNLFWKKNG